MAESEVAVVRRWFEEVWNKGNEKLMEEMLTHDLRAHGINSGDDVMHGIEEFRPFYQGFRNTFPDVEFTIDEAISEGALVATRWTARMTHLGDAFAPATNKRLTVTGMTFWRIRDNKIAEAWNNWDMMGMLNTIGQSSHTKVL